MGNLKHINWKLPSNIGMIYVQLAPLEITMPEYLAVMYKGVTQLRQNSNRSILSLLNMILAMSSSTYRGVYTFSNRMTVLFWHEEFKKMKKMLHNNSSISISFCSVFYGARRIFVMDLERNDFLGTFYPTKPIRSHYEPISIMMSSFLLFTSML